VLGTLAIGVIIFACSSSTPMLSAMVAAAGLAVFGYRHIRKRIWVSVLVSLAVLQLFMDRPVWHLFARVDLVGGSTGWHRFIILETFFEHFDKWWVSGESDATSWGVWQMRDITNQFILEGLRGGLLTLLCFTAVVIYAFGNVGRSLTAMAPLKNEFAERVAWLVGVTIFLHTVTFFGVSYFGQMTAILYMHIALCGALAAQIVPNLLAGNAPVPEVPETPRSRRARIAAGAARRRQTSAGLPK
jgi:hypothetical protein